MYTNETKKQQIDYTDTAEIKALFVGRKVVSVDESTRKVTLDNGVVVRVVPNDGCGGCPSGHYDVKSLNMLKNVEHIITAVKVVQIDHPTKDPYDEPDVTYQIAVYAAGVGVKKGRRTNLVELFGTDGNGYYGTGFTLEVTKA